MAVKFCLSQQKENTQHFVISTTMGAKPLLAAVRLDLKANYE